MSKFVLITPARNEAAYIARTIRSVLGQTVTPAKWIIISDGSEDATEHIVTGIARDAGFIELIVRKAGATPPGLNPKVAAFNQAIGSLPHGPYDFIGNLDADIELDRNYYETLLGRFEENGRLGVAGGVLLEDQSGRLAPRFGDSPFHVAGAIQLIRRACFEAVGGFDPNQHVGEDTVLEVMARMKGWEVSSFPGIHAVHLRATGSSYGAGLRYTFHDGLRDYANGAHPIYELAKCVRRIPQRPFLLGSCGIGCGYLWGRLTSAQRPPDDVVRFMRGEQLARLRTIMTGFGPRSGGQ